VTRKITDIRLGAVIKYLDCVGDTWDPAWAADGNLYFPGNDGSGWKKAASGNLFFNSAAGDDPARLSIRSIAMPEYGGWAEKGPDGCTWKSSGCVAVDGDLYLGVARHAYGTDSGDPHRRQSARRASIIRSTDGGQTWERSAQQNYNQPMFASGRFATPYFIHYGQDGATPDVDGSGQYIYAISNNGFWCNGDDYVLGRVERARLKRLAPADWQFYRGGDGLLPDTWTSDLNAAQPIIHNLLKCGESGATYIPALGRYLLIAWGYPGDPNIETDETCWTFYESPTPWGPWELVKEVAARPEGWYCPRLLVKWQRLDGDVLRGVIITGGDYYEMDKHYCLTFVPLELKLGGAFPPAVAPVTRRILPTGADITTSGNWQPHTDGEIISDEPDASATVKFNGTRLRWIASKENNRGLATVQMDGGAPQTIDLYTYCVVPQPHRIIFDSGELPPGEHTLTLQVSGERSPKSTGLGVTLEYFEITE
jgi:hypothetical protein